MSSRWDLAAVEKAAPDASSLAAARKLAKPGPWSETGSTESLVWGKCQGSGKVPYQVSIDLAGPAYRCSCPSRKFPCKHALALLLLWVRGDGAVAEAAEASGFAGEWAQQRSERAGRAEAAAAAPAKPADPEAQARRRAERMATMSVGIDDFGLWLTDLVRAGTVAARRQPWAWWDAVAARLVDGQLPGLAERVREMGSQVNARDDWADHLLEEVGRWWAAVRAWQQWQHLDATTRADLRAYVGWAQSTDDVRAGETLADTWFVLGAHRSDDGRLQQQRTWLRGQRTGETVQLLDFAAQGCPLPMAQLAGGALEVSLALYPGSRPRRALMMGDPAAADLDDRPGGSTLAAAFASFAAAHADNPWVARVPAVLEAAVLLPAREGAAAQVVDADGVALPLLGPVPWSALALTGAAPTLVVGELEAEGFRLLSVQVDDRMVAV